MIVVGTMNLTRTRERGDFHCPSCATMRGYRLRARRPFLTLYFIPTLPIGAAELFVDCDGCNENWDQSVLETNYTAQEELHEDEFREQAIRAAVLVALVDDSQSEQEKQVLQRVSSHLLQREVDVEEIGQLCSSARENKISAQNYVLTVSRRWDRDQRSLALQAMFLVATAEGELSDSQIQLLSRMREILDMEQTDYESAIELAFQWD